MHILILILITKTTHRPHHETPHIHIQTDRQTHTLINTFTVAMLVKSSVMSPCLLGVKGVQAMVISWITTPSAHRSDEAS